MDSSEKPFHNSLFALREIAFPSFKKIPTLLQIRLIYKHQRNAIIIRNICCRTMTFTTSKTTTVAAQDEDLEEYPDRIAAIYSGKTILVTGGTGFMGKVLVEKLLRCCTGVKRIYLLVRSKKGKDPNERLKDVFNNPVRSI